MFWLHTCWLILLASRFTTAASHRLQLTAVVSDDNQNAAFECWEITNPFSDYPTAGSAIMGLADVSNVSYVVLPPGSKEGLHKPPHPMLFALISGSAHITLPEGEDELWIWNGINGLIIAVDTVGRGHYTEYSLTQPSVALQIPFKHGEPPGHLVVKHGPCDSTGSVVGYELPDFGKGKELR